MPCFQQIFGRVSGYRYQCGRTDRKIKFVFSPGRTKAIPFVMPRAVAVARAAEPDIISLEAFDCDRPELRPAAVGQPIPDIPTVGPFDGERAAVTAAPDRSD